MKEENEEHFSTDEKIIVQQMNEKNKALRKMIAAIIKEHENTIEQDNNSTKETISSDK